MERSGTLKEDKSFVDKYKIFVDKSWFVKIKKSKMDRWVNNFEENLCCAHFLLNALILYKDPQIIAIISELQNVMQSQLYSELQQKKPIRINEKELFDLWGLFVKETCLIAVVKPDSNSGSGHQAIRLWRDNSRFIEATVIKLEEKILEGYKNIFFVDDFIGTGKRINDFLSDNIINKNSHSQNVYDIVQKYQNVKFGVITFAAYKNTIDALKTKYQNINFLSSEIFDDSYDLLSENCRFFTCFEKEKNNIRSYIKEKRKSMKKNNDYALNLSIAFEYGFPNNSLELYWSDQNQIDDWCELMKHRRSY